MNIAHTIRAATYRLTMTADERATLEFFARQLPAHNRWLERMIPIVDRWRTEQPSDANAQRAWNLLQDADGTFSTLARQFAAAAEAARTDGQRVEARLVPLGQTDAAMGVVPIIVVIALGSVAIVCMYLAYRDTLTTVAWFLNARSAITQLVAAGRPDLVAGVLATQGQGQAGKDNGALWLLGGLVAAAGVLYAGSRLQRKGDARG